MTTKCEDKTLEFAKLIYRLRQSIDLLRVIGLNTKQLTSHGVSKAFWAYVQMMAHESIANTTCKIFEREDRYERNSICGIIDALPEGPWSKQQVDAIVAFGASYGVSAAFGCLKCHLRSTLHCFECSHEPCLNRLKAFRNKHVAHSQHGFSVRFLPSIEEFEQVFEFADAFYRVVSGALLSIGPARIESQIGRGAMRIMKALGISEPKYDFDEERA